MGSDPTQTWPDAIPGSRLSREEQVAEDRLASIDHSIGLEQQAKELREESLASPSEATAIEANAAIRSSPNWLTGRVALLPMRVLRRVKRRVLG